MTVSQKVHIDTNDYGASLTLPTLANLTTGATIADGTAASCNEQTADSGVYIADFVGASSVNLIPAGTYRILTSVSGAPLKRFVTLTGVDGEVAYARTDRHAVLDSASLDEIKGPGWDENTDTLGKIRDAITSIATTSVVIPSPISEVIGMPETLEIGDSYDGETPIKLYVRDDADDPVTVFSGHDLADPDFAPTFTIAPTPGSPRGRVKGTVTYVPASGPDEGYLKVEIPSRQSKLAVEGESSVQCVLKWDGYEKTLLSTTVRWLPRI